MSKNGPSSIKSKAILRLGFAFKKEGWINNPSPGLDKICQIISAKTGWPLPAPKDRAAQWEMAKQYDPFGPYRKIRPLEPAKAKKPKSDKNDAVQRQADRVAFYASPAWRNVRYRALKACGAACQCCGSTAKSSGRPLHVDHIKPRHFHPELELDLTNLQVLCEDCNLGKSAWDETDWRYKNIV